MVRNRVAQGVPRLPALRHVRMIPQALKVAHSKAVAVAVAVAVILLLDICFRLHSHMLVNSELALVPHTIGRYTKVPSCIIPFLPKSLAHAGGLILLARQLLCASLFM